VITSADADVFARCIHAHGVAVFPADTVYGLACDPDADAAVQRLYALKGRRPDKPTAVMFFSFDLALAALPELDRRTRAALERLLPGGVTVLLPNPSRRFPLACGPDPDTLGLRVPALPDPLAPLAAMRWPVLQSSANRSATAPTACSTAANCPEPRRRWSTCAPTRARAAGASCVRERWVKRPSCARWTSRRPEHQFVGSRCSKAAISRSKSSSEISPLA